MMNLLVIEKDHVTNRIDRGIPLKDIGMTSFTHKKIPISIVLLLNFLIVTDTEAGEFKYLKSRDPILDIEKTYPLSELEDHLEIIQAQHM